MVDTIAITWTTQTTPAGAQPRWSVTTALDLSLPGRRHVGRIPAGAPIPSGAQLYAPPVVTEALRDEARRKLEEIAAGDDWLRAELADGALERLDETITRNLGVVHPYAELAPWSVATLDEACRLIARARDLWTSPCSCAVIRTSIPGYYVWTGIGGMMEPVGHADTYEGAEMLARGGVALQRAGVIRRVREILAGWSPDTPYWTATLATIEDLPLQIRRGPMTAAESPGARVVQGLTIGGTSWDLPVVYRLDGHGETRWPERVTWDDDASRQAHRDRTRAGQSQRRAEERHACDLLRAVPRLAPIVRKRSLAAVDVQLRGGDVVRTLGGVRMREDSAVPLALVRYRGMRMWMALGHFAA